MGLNYKVRILGNFGLRWNAFIWFFGRWYFPRMNWVCSSVLLGTHQSGCGGLWVQQQQQPVECVSAHWLRLACIKSRSGRFNQIHREHPPTRTAVCHARNVFNLLSWFVVIFSVESPKKGPIKPWRKEEIRSRWWWDANWFSLETFNAEKRRCCRSWRRTVTQR